MGKSPLRFLSAQVIRVWQCPLITGTLIRKSIRSTALITFSFMPAQSTLCHFSFCPSMNGTSYFSHSARYPQYSYASDVRSPTQDPSTMVIFPNCFSCRYSTIPATTSGCVVAPNSAGEGTTRFGLIPIRVFRSPISFSSSVSSSSFLVISL